MEALIKMVADKAGISEQQATTAVNAVVSFLKDKLPGGMGEQLESFTKGGGGSSFGNMTDNLRDKMGGIFGK